MNERTYSNKLSSKHPLFETMHTRVFLKITQLYLKTKFLLVSLLCLEKNRRSQLIGF